MSSSGLGGDQHPNLHVNNNANSSYSNAHPHNSLTNNNTMPQSHMNLNTTYLTQSITSSYSSTGPMLQGSGSNPHQTLTLAPLPHQPGTVQVSSANTLVIQQPQDQSTAAATGLPLTPVTVDLPTIQAGQPGATAVGSAEDSGVLLCNLDDLSR